MNFVVENEKEFVEKTWKTIEPKIGPGFVLGLVGDLGAGKTTLVKYIAKKLGYKDNVNSPTFMMKQSYVLPAGDIKTIEHIDLYRQDGGAGDDQEVLEWLDSGDSLTVVEWADIISNSEIFDLMIDIKLAPNNSRKVSIK